MYTRSESKFQTMTLLDGSSSLLTTGPSLSLSSLSFIRIHHGEVSSGSAYKISNSLKARISLLVFLPVLLSTQNSLSRPYVEVITVFPKGQSFSSK